MNPLDNKIRKRLQHFKYNSRMTGQPKGLMDHHIDALTPLIRSIVEEECARMEKIFCSHGRQCKHCGWAATP